MKGEFLTVRVDPKMLAELNRVQGSLQVSLGRRVTQREALSSALAAYPVGVAPEAATLTGVGQPTSQPSAPTRRKAKADAA